MEQYHIFTLACKTCHSKFATETELINHQIEIHYSKVKYRSCTDCDYKTTAEYRLLRHLRIHGNCKPIQCLVCCSKFGNMHALKVHMVKLHSDEKPYECIECQQKFNTSVELKLHDKIHRAHNQTICTVCDSQFATRTSLRHHMTTHTGLKPYACTLCDKRFVRNWILRDHYRKIHKCERP